MPAISPTKAETTVRLALFVTMFCITVVIAFGSAHAADTPPKASNRSREDARAQQLRIALDGLIDHGGVVVGSNGGVLFEYGGGRYRPASILKIATALVGLNQLGERFRFKTEFFLDSRRNLIVKGYGDPYLISEEWALIGRELRERGVFERPLRDLVLDGSAIDENVKVDGVGNSTNPFDARLGALVVNFNTINVRVNPGGRAESAEPQTPLTPLAVELAQALPAGTHRINLSRQPGNSKRYTGELVRALLERAGASFTGIIDSGATGTPGPRRGASTTGLQAVLVHRASRELPQVVAGMLKFSNNFIANQIVLNLGLSAGVQPATLESGVEAMRLYFRARMNLGETDLTLAEGSGISRRNRVGLLAMLRIVDAFHPWRHLLRLFGPVGRQVPAKTGNLRGVYALAGFLPAPGNERRPFVMMLNQSRNTRNRVFEAIYRAYADPRSS